MDVAGGISSLMAGVVVAAVSWLLHAAITATNVLLASSLFQFKQLPNQALTDAGYVRGLGFLILVTGIVWIGLRTQVSAAARLPGRGGDFERMVLAAIMVLGSLWFCEQLLSVNNAIGQHFVNLIDQGTAPVAGVGAVAGQAAAAAAVDGSLTAALALFAASPANPASLAGLAVLTGIATLALIVLMAVLFLLYVIRMAEIVFFTLTMPIWSALYAFPETARVLGAAYTELVVTIFQQAFGVIAWWLGTTLILNFAPGTGFGQAFANVLTAMGMVYILLKIPATLRRILGAGGSSGGFVSTVAQTHWVASRLPALGGLAARAPWLP